MVKKTILWQAHEGNLSGANLALLEFIDALKTEFDFWVVLPHEGDMNSVLEQRKISYSIIHNYGWAISGIRWELFKYTRMLLRSMIAICQIRRLIRNVQPSYAFTNTLVPFTLSIAAKQLKVPHVWWIHEFGEDDFGFKIGWGFEQWAFKWMQRSSRIIISNSKAIRIKFSERMPSVKIVCIYQPVSWNHNTTIKVAKKAQFLMFGQIVDTKGHKDVLEALIAIKKMGKEIPSLHILGPNENSSYLNELHALIKSNELNAQVKIEVGYVECEKILPHYDVLIVASKAEAFGRVIVEANKAGLQVLVRNSGGAPELINESNGLLFDNTTELIAALSGEKRFPIKSGIRMNYDETKEIKKLKHVLQEICP